MFTTNDRQIFLQWIICSPSSKRRRSCRCRWPRFVAHFGQIIFAVLLEEATDRARDRDSHCWDCPSLHTLHVYHFLVYLRSFSNNLLFNLLTVSIIVKKKEGGESVSIVYSVLRSTLSASFFGRRRSRVAEIRRRSCACLRRRTFFPSQQRCFQRVEAEFDLSLSFFVW